VRAALASGILVWIIALLIAPRAMASRNRAASLCASGLYVTGALICHQRPERSFHLAGRSMPVCARCTGLYAGAALAAPLAMVAAAAALAAARARMLALAAALPTITTWCLEFFGGVPFSNAARFAAALPLGFVAAWLVLGAAASMQGRELHGPPPEHEGHQGHKDHPGHKGHKDFS
jgi:uncharacterized membrane protein